MLSDRRTAKFPKQNICTYFTPNIIAIHNHSRLSYEMKRVPWRESLHTSGVVISTVTGDVVSHSQCVIDKRHQLTE